MRATSRALAISVTLAVSAVAPRARANPLDPFGFGSRGTAMGGAAAADVPAAERTNLEVLRTDTPTFAALIESRRNRPEEFFKVRAGRIDLCNVPLAVRESTAAPSQSP